MKKIETRVDTTLTYREGPLKAFENEGINLLC